MVNIPSEVKALFKSDVIHKNFHVHFPNGETTDLNNEDVIAETVSFTESICSQQYFKFGMAESSEIEFTCVNVPNIKGSTIQCAIEIDVTSLGSSFITQHPVNSSLPFLTPQTVQWADNRYAYRVPYGEFVVDTCPRDHGAMFQRQVTAYSPMPFEGNTIFYGETPMKKLKIRPEDYVNAIFLDNSDMTKRKSAIIPFQSRVRYELIDAMTSGGDTIQFNGVGGSRNWYDVQDPLNKIVALRFDYTPHEFDNYAVDMFKKAMASFPNGTYTYEEKDFYNSGSGMYQVYANNAQAMSVCVGQFAPCYWVEVSYLSSANTDARHIVSKPVFIKPNKTYLVDFRKLVNNFVFINKLGSSYNEFYWAKIYFCVPWAWARTASWETLSLTQAVANWPLADKIDPNVGVVYRDETYEPSWVYIAEIESDLTQPSIAITNTGKVKKPALLNYYTFEDAIDEYEMVTGLLEVNGQFGRFGRQGKFERFSLDNSSPIAIEASVWEEFWWDENEISPIGQVDIAYNNSVEDLTKSIVIGEGRSLYDMTNNSVMTKTIMSDERAEEIITELFAPKAADVVYSAVDLTMKGLPYLEAGDYLELTSSDNETFNTYILQQTITGIQDLRATITSTNGELEGIVDE